MRPEENNGSGTKSGSPSKNTKNNVGKDELNYYTFQKTRKEGSGDRYTRNFEKFLLEWVMGKFILEKKNGLKVFEKFNIKIKNIQLKKAPATFFIFM